MLFTFQLPVNTKRKRQGKFQPFRRLFGKKTKREPKWAFDGAALKTSFSIGEVCNGVVSDDEASDHNLRELNPIGSRALSHDSVFIPEESVTGPSLGHSMSQENVSDKVRNLQKQIAQGIKFGQRPPSLRKSEGDEGSSDEEEVPSSPLKVLAQVEAEPANIDPKVQVAQHAEPHTTPVKSPRSKRALPPSGTIESINLDAVPQSVPRLDNTAAKHKLSVKPKNQRISRKHRRFTQDLQGVSIPGVVQEDHEAVGLSADDQRRASAEESLESFKKQKLHQEEQKTRRSWEVEEQRLKQEEEDKRRATEELKLRELEEKSFKQQQEEERRLRMEADRRRREEDEKRIREEEERRQREEEERRQREEEERRQQEEEERRMQEETERRLEEERKRLEEQRRKEQERRKREEEEEEEEARRQEELEAAKKRKLREEEEERKKKEEAEKRMRQEEEEQRRLSLEDADDCSDLQKRKRRAEELRWREMEERQRPFSFKVSSGEKQILFQKVNLTPVTPASSHQSGAVVEQRENPTSSSSDGLDSPSLLASPYVPHTAILVTGAQLCGTAVNLDQIRDTACKSLLGLGEDKKAPEKPLTKSKASPDRKSGKTKSLNESSVSSDQSGAAILAEWASIRSKIFKGVEEGKYDEYPDASRNQPQPGSDEPPAFSHTNLRKTMSASAKFSITPAKKKFGDSNRNSEVFGTDGKEAEVEATHSESSTAASPASTNKCPTRSSKTVRIVERGSEECMFAKDLPSFLVPSHGDKSECPDLRSRAQSEMEVSGSREEGEDEGQDGEDKPSPFGIKLRRTNYSLRFHSEQSTEKRKKRYSAGDSFDGVPSPLTPIEPDSETSSVFSDKSTPPSPQKEGAISKYLHASASPAVPRSKEIKSTTSIPHGEGEKTPSKQLLYHRQNTSKLTGSVLTPPPSPLPKVSHGPPSDALTHRTGSAESSKQQQTNRIDESSSVAQQNSQSQVEEEPKEKRSFFPSINIPWREKADRKTELIKKEKPSLQSRHSLDSSRVQEKEAGPLWITLALQKQKGFREQQQNREERRNQREAKLAEKQARDRDSVTLVSPTDSKGSGGVSTSSKPKTPDEPKRPESLLGRFERREHLKKANTLPSSVTVEIADSTPSPPAVKDTSKRFPSSDSAQVSTEPAWLALAKRKAKAWSDCPQIIK
ncbi:capping protein inhibiting regulator of actin dynamics isoform X2 [Antennarius striatus]|uniref:capping protein inhibiting regulator of actin dynamics isoform X2 n=1 Tax=Antennarius striatus TaxID=241820 RepID=UPI0035B4D2C4